MPIKAIGRDIGQRNPPQFSLTLATSERFAQIIARSFGVPLDDVWVTGLPRNDQLVKDSQVSPFERSFVVWLPTFRRSVKGERSSDGNAASGLPDIDSVREIVSVLESFQHQLVVKLHPMADPAEGEIFALADVTVIDDQWLMARGTTLYALLSCSSALITDYSSVAIDYMVTSKPMVLVQQDRRDYDTTRGLNFSLQELQSIAPVVETYGELPSALAHCLSHQRSVTLAEPFYSAPTNDVATTLVNRLLDTSTRAGRHENSHVRNI